MASLSVCVAVASSRGYASKQLTLGLLAPRVRAGMVFGQGVRFRSITVYFIHLDRQRSAVLLLCGQLQLPFCFLGLRLLMEIKHLSRVHLVYLQNIAMETLASFVHLLLLPPSALWHLISYHLRQAYCWLESSVTKALLEVVRAIRLHLLETWYA
jgi:hypothetical protein